MQEILKLSAASCGESSILKEQQFVIRSLPNSIHLAKRRNDSQEAGKCECRYNIEQDGYQNNGFETPTNGD